MVPPSHKQPPKAPFDMSIIYPQGRTPASTSQTCDDPDDPQFNPDAASPDHSRSAESKDKAGPCRAKSPAPAPVPLSPQVPSTTQGSAHAASDADPPPPPPSPPLPMGVELNQPSPPPPPPPSTNEHSLASKRARADATSSPQGEFSMAFLPPPPPPSPPADSNSPIVATEGTLLPPPPPPPNLVQPTPPYTPYMEEHYGDMERYYPQGSSFSVHHLPSNGPSTRGGAGSAGTYPKSILKNRPPMPSSSHYPLPHSLARHHPYGGAPYARRGRPSHTPGYQPQEPQYAFERAPPQTMIPESASYGANPTGELFGETIPGAP